MTPAPFIAGFMPELPAPQASTPGYRAPSLALLFPAPPALDDLGSQRIGTLIIGPSVLPSRGRPGRWPWRCDCGRAGTATTYDLVSGVRRTCGARACRLRWREVVGEQLAADVGAEAP